MIISISKKTVKVIVLIVLTGLISFVNAQNFDWSPAGPIYSAGRARNIIIDKLDVTGKTIYLGSASSGLFRTIDAGSNWEPLNDQGTIRNVSYISQASDGLIYVATGEGFLRPDKIAKAQKGTGLYKLLGSAGSFSLTKVQDSSIVGSVINRIACHPSNSAIIVLATNKGILISTNSGSSFTPAAGITATVNLTYGIDVKFDNAGILYCSIGSEKGTAPFTNISSKIYKSSDNSLTNFSDITPISSVLSDSNYGRIELAIAPSNNNVIYASCSKKYNYPIGNSASLQGLFVSYNSGLTWGLILQGSSQLDPLSNGSTVASGDFSQVLLVSHTNSNKLFFGGYKLYSFTRNMTIGSDNSPIGTWSQIGNPFAINTPFYLRQNIHDIKIVTGTPSKFYIVTDAGIYRSIDMEGSSQQSFLPPTFQPFYKGLITGQFNSVSIETFPLASNTNATANGSTVTPFSGFIGGTGGNGLTYFSGNYPLATQETNYLGGDVYNSDFSKILPGVALFSNSNGGIYRSSNIKSSDPNIVDVNVFSGALSVIAPSSSGFSNSTYTLAGSPFKFWENYGQLKKTPDSLVFYNDSLRLQASMIGLSTLTTQTSFAFSAVRPSKYAIIDSLVIRTGTVVLPIASFANCPTVFNTSDKKDICIKISNSVPSGSIVVPAITSTTGPMSAAGVTLNAVTLSDNISITFNSPPFATKTTSSYPVGSTGSNVVVSDPAAYYRVFATIFYRYNVGDSIKITDNSISTKVLKYSSKLTVPLKWDLQGSRQSYSVSAITNSAVSNPTYVLNPGAISQSNPVFTITPIGIGSYTIIPTGNYNFSAPIINYSISAITNTAIINPTYNLMPGNITQTTAIFVVSPNVASNYTISQISLSNLTSNTFSSASNSSTITAVSNTAISNSTYNLMPGNVIQSNAVFVVSPTVATNYTITQIGTTTSSASTIFTLIIGNQTLTANTNTAISNSTYNLMPGNITQSSPVFTVSPLVATDYTITEIGTIPSSSFTYSFATNIYTFTANTNTAISNSTYNLMPGNIIQSSPVFTVSPLVATNYTITQSGSGNSIIAQTFSAIGASTYVLNPGNISQSSPIFTVSYNGVNSFTAQGISSNTLLASNTSATFIKPVNTSSVVGSSKVPFSIKNPIVKIPTILSARIAIGLNMTGITTNAANSNAIVVSKAPLNLNDPLNFVRVSQSGCLTSDAQGNSTFSTIAIPGKPTLIEWSKGGSELYYATDDYKLYRVSNINSIMDLSPTSYSGKLSTDIFKYPFTNTSDTNRLSPYRTTLLGSFTKPITSISITKDDSLMAITFADPTGTIVSYSSKDIRKSNFSNINFVSKNGTGLSTASVVTYCSLLEKDDNRKMFIGTDNGIFYTNDITQPSPVWEKANNNQLPNVQIFDIKQQVLNQWDCYNSGQIYVATNGRGVWFNNKFFKPFTVSEMELEKSKIENNMSLFPNPSNGIVYVKFNGSYDETAFINIIDINGRVVKSDNLGKLNTTQINYMFDTNELTAGIYIVNINGSSGLKRVAKLIVTK